MDDGLRSKPAQCLAQHRRIADVGFDQMAPLHQVAVAARQIVVDHNFVSGLGQQLGRMAADVARPAGHQKSRHAACLPPNFAAQPAAERLIFRQHWRKIGCAGSHQRTCLWRRQPGNREIYREVRRKSPLGVVSIAISLVIPARYGKIPCNQEQAKNRRPIHRNREFQVRYQAPRTVAGSPCALKPADEEGGPALPEIYC